MQHPHQRTPHQHRATDRCAQDKAGYSGVATLSRTAPLSVSQGFGHKDHDGEGRVLVTEYDKLFVVGDTTTRCFTGPLLT